MLKTTNCIKCGKPATVWCGTVVGKQRMALGNLMDVKVAAGFCDEHITSELGKYNHDYGEYNATVMGKCIPLFSK